MAVPPSTMKKSQNKRLSVAGPAARGPAALAVPSTQLLYRSQNMNPLLASASKHGRTPLTAYVVFICSLVSAMRLANWL
jgi:hypothetical protein